MTKKLLNLLLITTIVALGINIGFAQATSTGTIVGSAADKAGGMLVGATVVSTNKGTGATRNTTTNASGNFRFDQVSAGPYVVKVTREGFATYAESLEVLVGQTATVNASLKPGQATEVVEVAGDIQLIDQAKTSVSQEITPKEVIELPLLGRDAANLAYLAPGVKAADSYDPTKARYAIISVNGQGGRNINVTVNGVDNKDNSVGGMVMQMPLEGVQEFTIATQRFSAANGRSEGAAINMITKSGSNNYHGSLFGFFRDHSLNADLKSADGHGGQTVSNPPYTRQQFGGSVGGPIIKDKLFTFFAIERQREHTSLSENADALAQLSLLTAFGAQPAAVIPTPFFETRYTGRMDYQFNTANRAYFSYSSQANNSQNDQSDGYMDLSAGNTTTNHMQIANLTLDSVINPTTVNQLTFGFQYWNNNISTKTVSPLLTFPGGGQDCNNGGICFGTNTNVPQQSFQRKWQFKDDLSKTVRNHTLKFGADYVWEQALGGFFEFNTPLEIDFAAKPADILGNTALYPQGLSTPGLVTGISWANGDPATNVPGGTKQFGVYFQDDWKVSKRLTLNLGVRWDKDFNMVEGSAVQNSRTYQELLAIAGNPAVSTYLHPFTYKQPSDDSKNFSPRIGFAYDLTGDGRQVLRGGFGLYYGDIFQNIPIFMEQQHNPTIFQAFNLAAGTSGSPGDVVPGTGGTTVENWSYSAAAQAALLVALPGPSAQLQNSATGYIIDPKYKNPVTEEFNIGYSVATTKSSAIEVEYVHVLSLHENKTININPTLPTDPANVAAGFARPLSDAFTTAGVPVLGQIRDQQSIGRSRYDGLNFSFHQRLTHHFSMNANYTLARAYSYGGGDGSYHNYSRDPRFPLASYEWGPSPNDERHHITVSGVVQMPYGFQLSPILQFGSARPYDVNTTTNWTGLGTNTQHRGVVVPNSDPTNYLWALSQTQTAVSQCYFSGSCTMAKFDALRGDPTFNLDLRLAKNVKLKEGINLQLVAQAFNLTNRANYGNNFDGIIDDFKADGTGTFHHPAGFVNPGSQSVTPRALLGEFGFRLSF
jgi:outer membrane receptor protein involved in Fe transport